MKKIVCFLIGCLCFKEALAQERNWAKVYEQIFDTYVYDVTIDKIGVAALKGLNKIDKNLQVGNDNFRVSLYYKGKLVKVLNKPKSNNDAILWGKLTENIIDEATRVSPTASEKDFLIEDFLAEGMVSVLDDASKYYRSIDEADGNLRNHRVFAARNDEKFFYIKIKAFNRQTLANLEEEFKNFDKQKAIIFDLRGCSGGMAGVAIETADLFLDAGIICSTKSKNSMDEIYYTAKSGDIVKGSPIFILVDEKTASAAEIFTAALQEQSRAKVIGTLSTGKGTMQKLISLPNGGVLAVTNRFVFTPSGQALNKKGIIPDICTFERNESQNLKALMEQKDVICSKEQRENHELELKIVKEFLKE